MKDSPRNKERSAQSCAVHGGDLAIPLRPPVLGPDGCMHRRVIRLLFLLVVAGLLPDARANQAQNERGRTRSPHDTLRIACTNCHTSTSWNPIRPAPEFNHNETRYPLRGLHVSLDCRQCHVRLAFANTPKICANCHADVHRRQFGGNCEECHTVRGWQVSARSIREHLNRFPLFGAHAAIDCDACHKGAVTGQFVGLNTACSSCHLSKYQATRTPDHQLARLPIACDQCHNIDSWPSARFDHSQYTTYPLAGAHIPLACVQCHVGNRFTGTPRDCFSCHVQDFNAAKDPDHVQAGLGHDCQGCHSLDYWARAKFDHSTTKFALTGAHVTPHCQQCHIAGRYAGTPTDCYSCHVKDFESAANPNHKTGNFPTDCAGCHATTDWLNARFDHNLAKFRLTGAHAAAACSACHAPGSQYATTSTSCQSCHTKEFNSTTNPNHVATGFPLDCSFCHDTNQWTGAKFDHTTGTKFPLNGAHVPVTCAGCHKNNVFAGLATSCLSCHQTDLDGTKNPNHLAAGFPQDCSICHSSASWANAAFNHNTATKYPLAGAHVTVVCNVCHKDNVYAGLASSCISCHLTDWNGTKNPNHVSAGFTQNCETCHTTTQWPGAKFDHNQTKFMLTGAHVAVACQTCHANNQFSTLNTACMSCHETDFNGTKNPNHPAAGFPQDCSICHNTTQWTGANFDHNTRTKFPLAGAHGTVQCSTCHKNNVFAGTPSACISCHQTDFNGTNNPNHTAAGFPQDCSVCHSTTSWANATFNHNTATKFTLTGTHINVACSTCHRNGVYAGLATSCISCHQADWNNTTNPNHATAGFPQDCSTCHSVTAGWAGATFNHSTGTRFPLTGAHGTVACSVCHKNNVFAGLSTTCISCHQTDWNSTNNPNHGAAGFPQDCSICHSTTSWANATFNHNSATKFPLTGAHPNAACNVCHKNNVFAGLATTCISCHQTDFSGTNNPNHTAAGFPQDCSICHSTTSWANATFNHNTATKFTLTGAHINVACSACHQNGVYVGLATSCISCHQSDWNNTTNPNHGAAGFPQDCSTCHSVTAGWVGAVFNHSTQTKFPLTGAHVSVVCNLCHKNNAYVGLATACISCHLTDWNGANNPNHVTAGFPQDCSVCHSVTAGWAGAVFNHSTKTKFPLTGAHVNVACTNCHINNNFTTTPTDCYSCHSAEYKSVSNPNHAAAGFPTTCQTCHTTTAWTGATFNHTWFPMTHHNSQGLCSTCHTNSNDYSVFVCTSCHTQTQTDSHHRGVRNYIYNSVNCYACHPRGSGG